MSTALAPRAAPVTVCDGCGQPVMRLFTVDQAHVVLDPELVPGGIYALDQYNRAARRPLVELFAAQRDGTPLLGRDPHECKPVPWYAR